MLAMAGMALAADGTGLTLENATGWVSTKGDSYADWTVSELELSKNDSGDLVISGDIAEQLALGGSTRSVTVIAFTLDLSKLNIPTNAEGTAYEAGRVFTLLNGTTEQTGLGVNANGVLTGTWTTNMAYYTSAASLVGTGESSFVYVLGTGNGTQAAGGTAIYAGDENTVWSNNGLKGNIGNVSTMTMESWVADALVSMVVWSGAEAYNNKALVADAFAVNQSIPEPTTATLSLLALAGLAARRRRK